MHVNIGLPAGRCATTLEEALVAFDDVRLWETSDAELHLGFAEPRAMLTVLRRNHLGACLHLRRRDSVQRRDDDWISLGDQSVEGVECLELQDVSILYPRRFFVDLACARHAIRDFACPGKTPAGIHWATLSQTDLAFVEA